MRTGKKIASPSLPSSNITHCSEGKDFVLRIKKTKMPKSLSKVTKKVAKKKGRTDSLHEKSRDSKRIRRASAREEKLSKAAITRTKLNEPYLQRISFVKDLVKDNVEGRELSSFPEVIRSYIHRNDEEIAQLQKLKRPGQSPSNKAQNLNHRLSRETVEFGTGFWWPDTREKETVERLLSWDGQWPSLALINFVRVTSSGDVQKSGFPPKGAY